MEEDPFWLQPAEYEGQVIDPDPLQELPSPRRSEIDGHEEGDAMDIDEEDPERTPWRIPRRSLRRTESLMLV